MNTHIINVWEDWMDGPVPVEQVRDKPLVVLGSAPGWDADLKRAPVPADVMAVGRAVLEWPGRIHHFMSLDVGYAPFWVRRRIQNGGAVDFRVHVPHDGPYPGLHVTLWRFVNVEGLTCIPVAVLVGLALGYPSVVVAGMGDYPDDLLPGREHNVWRALSVLWGDRVRVLSGWAADMAVA